MYTGTFLRNVIIKALLLFAAANLLLAAIPPGSSSGISIYNHWVPGRSRFPFGENPQKSYNLSLYDLEAMFKSHELTAGAKPENEYRVLVIGDSSIWGTLLTPGQTLAGRLNDAGQKACDGRDLKFYNLGYPTLSLTKDVMILNEAMKYQPDLILWPLTLESFVRSRQLNSPIAANNVFRIAEIVDRYQLDLPKEELVTPDFWDRTLVGRRRALADWTRLQLFGILWAATGVDQEYPPDYPKAKRDLEPETEYYGWTPPSIPGGGLAFDVLSAGYEIAGSVPVVLINEPVMISTGENSDIRYNFYYPRWVYDSYRSELHDYASDNGKMLLDYWDLIVENEFTNSAIHLSPLATEKFAQKLVMDLTGDDCQFWK